MSTPNRQSLAPHNPSPLRLLIPHSIPDIGTMTATARRVHPLCLNMQITASGAWLRHWGVPTSGQWFGIRRVAAQATGTHGLYGCTALLIVTDQRVYLAHFYEDTVFQLRTQRAFRVASFGALLDDRRVQTSLSFVRNAGYLAPEHHPAVFVITPHVYGSRDVLLYHRRAWWIARAAAAFVYYTPRFSRAPLVRGYHRTNDIISPSDQRLDGHVLVEVALINGIRRAPGGHELFSRWRVWAAGDHIADHDCRL
ncbi:hypothetical protein BJX62DRAFT_236298 [Aspergillus germanicus]